MPTKKVTDDNFDNEVISIQYNYQSGFIVDTAFSYYKTGNLKSQALYKDNELNGEQIIFFPDGGVKERGFFVDGLKDGNWCIYDSLGVKIECYRYKRGVKNE